MLASARAYGIPFEELTTSEVRQRWPQLNPSDNFSGGLEKEAGVIFPESSIHALLSESEKAGATLQFDERVDQWESTGDQVSVRTTKCVYEGGRLLLTAGARNSSLVKGMASKPKRVPVLWVNPPHSPGFRLGELPVNYWQLPYTRKSGEPAYREIYSLPVIRPGGRIKVAAHSPLADCDPDTAVDDVTVDELAPIHNFIDNYIPSLSERDITLHTCLYSSTLDGNFILGPLSKHPHVFSAALAGHGFKFAPVLGEILADMTMGHSPGFDVSMFSSKRFESLDSPIIR
jgi:sarcosine oxidase